MKMISAGEKDKSLEDIFLEITEAKLLPINWNLSPSKQKGDESIYGK